MPNRKLLLRAGILLLAVSVLGTAALCLHGCAAKVPATASTPGRVGTPIENVLAYNASLADANRSVANAVIAAQQVGGISVDAANKVLTAQSTIADADRQLTYTLQEFAVTLQANPGAKLSAGTITRLLDVIRASAQPLVTSGDVGIKNAQDQQQVLSSLTAIVGLVQQIAGALNSAGLMQ